ncbi:MAG: response regulator transcription factor [Desulfatibacillaceae bacterium]
MTETTEPKEEQQEQRKPTVIVADDEPHLRVLMRSIMRSMGIDIVGEAKNGKEAVEMWREFHPDLLLLDVNMPLMDGEDVLKEIMQDDEDAFVIMLTSVSDLGTVEKCVDLGASNYIRKDTPIPEIKKLIRTTWTEVKSGGGA